MYGGGNLKNIKNRKTTKLTKISIALLAAALSLSSCTASTPDDTESKTTTKAESSAENFVDFVDTEPSDFDEKYKACQDMYPDKSVLVWLTDDYVRYENQLNEYLADNGYDYVICFRTVEMSSDYGNTYLRAVENIAQSGEIFDILDSFSVCLVAEAVSNSYYYLASNNLFAPLETYLTDEKYTDIYSLMPQKYWSSYEFDGHIYGVDNSFSTLYADSGMLVYNDILDQNGVSAEDFSQPLDELEPTLKAVYEACNKPFNFSCSFWTQDIFTANYPMAIGIAISNSKAVNVFEQPETLQYYKLLEKYSAEGFVTVDSPSEISAGYNCEHRAAFGNTLSNNISAAPYTEVYNHQNNFICSPTNAVGVYSGSENKDLAADAILNVLYNKEINNIITYGAEGVQYDVENGKAVMRYDDNAPFRIDRKYNDPLISYPSADENDIITPLDYYSAYESAEYLDGCGFFFDLSDEKLSAEYLNVVNKISEFSPPYSNSDKDNNVENYIAEFNRSLYNAGLQDILDEANKQLEEYNETH